MQRISPLLAIGIAIACAPPKPATPYPDTTPPRGRPLDEEAAPKSEPETVGDAHYFDREIELEPFLAGFPYTRLMPSLDTQELFFIELGDRYRLKRLEIPDGEFEALKLGRAETIGDADWSKRSLWGLYHPEGSPLLWLHADAKNDEQMNLWTLDLEDGELRQVTDHDYVYGFGFDENDERIAYLPRKGTKAPYETCLHILDPESKRDRKIACDDPKLRYTWGRPRFSPDGKQVYFNAQIEGDRRRVQLVRVKLDAKKPRAVPVTDTEVRRNSPSTLEGWVDGDTLLFRANDDGYYNLHAFSQKTGKVRQLTNFKEDLVSAELTERGVVGVHRTPAGSTLVLVDPRSGAVLAEQKKPGSASVIDAQGNAALVTQQSPDTVFEASWIEAEKQALKDRVVVELDPELEQDIVQCKATAVRIPTFDEDPGTGKTRELHAFLLEPKRPLENPKHQLGLIRSFYGGKNAYNTYDQIMCAAGMVLVSPAVRGSSGFGKEFASLNDRDLGGKEIVDLFYVARWLEARTGLSPSRIGVYGRSHGGYATMRALTFPSEFQGHERYPFGFGLADAGFSDIKTFYDATNIPDWVVLESGDPEDPDDLARIRQRSPLTHVERLDVPLLIIHGSNDWRVPVQESRQFVEKARAADKPVQYVEFEGQGHHIEGLELQTKAYQVRFDFLKAVATANPPPESAL